MSFETRVGRLEMPKALRVEEELGRLIRLRAAINDQTIQLEILHLLKVGIAAEPIDLRKLPTSILFQIEREGDCVQRKAH